jgi:predicted RNA methylase
MTESNESVPYRVARRARDPRLIPLRAAISRALLGLEDAVVIDVASGGGLLAAWAAESPSVSRVYAIEDDPLQARHTHLALSGHASRQRIEVVETENLLTYQPPEPWHVMLCDVVSAGLLRQPQAPLVNHYLPFAAGVPAVVPQAVASFATLLDLDLSSLPGGLTLDTPFEDPQGLAWEYGIAPPVMLGTVSFDRCVPGSLTASVQVAVHTAGWARAVFLETKFAFPGADPDVASPYAPTVLLLDRPVRVAESEQVTLKIRLAHRQADAEGRASVGALPARLDASITWTN